MTSSLYVYYKVTAPDTPLYQRLLALQQELRTRCTVTARLLHRRDDPATWMEAYEGISDDAAFAAALAEAEQRHDIAALTGPRHAEWFQAFDTMETKR